MTFKSWITLLTGFSLVFILSACGVISTPTPSPEPTATHSATPPPTPSPTVTLTPTATVTPTSTLTPTLTSTPSPTPTVSPLLASRPNIQAANANQLQQVAQWGLGTISAQRSLRGGKLVLATTQEGLYLYESVSFKRIQFFQKARLPLISDDEALLAYSAPNQLGLYDLANLKELKSLPVAAAMVTGAFSPDGRFLAVVHSSVDIDVIQLEDLAVISLTRERTASREPQTNRAAFSPDNQFLVTGEGGGIVMWNIAEKKLLWYLKNIPQSVPSHPFSPDGRQLLTSDLTYTYLRDVRFGTQLFSGLGFPSSAPFSPDGKLFFLNNKGVVTIYTAGDFPGGVVRILVPEGPGGTYFSPDSARFFAGNKVLNLADFKTEAVDFVPQVTAGIDPIQALRLGHVSGLKGFSTGPQGQLWAWGSLGRTLYLWETVSGALHTAEIAGSKLIANLAFNVATMRFAACTDKGLEVLSLKDGARKLFNMCADNGLVAFSPDGARLARASTYKVELLNPEDGSTFNHLNEHNLIISKLSFSADGQWLAVGTIMNTFVGYSQISLWKMNPPTLVTGFRGQQITFGVGDLAVSPDGEWLLGMTNMLRLWRTSNAEQIKFNGKYASIVAVSPDSRLVATGGYQGVDVWNIPGLELVGALLGQGQTLAVGFSGNGANLVTLGADGMVRLWAVP